MAEDRIKCPICAELIKPGAKKCRFCGEWLGESGESKENGASKAPLEFLYEREETHEPESKESEEKPPEAEPVAKAEVTLVKPKRPFPWLRIILFLAYVAIIAALVCSERAAHQLLRDAETQEKALNYQAAFDTYSTIVHRFPFSLAVIETQSSLQRLSDPNGFVMPRPSWLDPVEDVLAKETTVCDVYLLSFVAWPACAVLLALVFLTRILRPGTALFVLILLAATVAGSVVQLSWYETVLPTPIAEGLLEEPMVIYGVTYVLLVVTALMTLTATRKRKGLSANKMATARR